MERTDFTRDGIPLGQVFETVGKRGAMSGDGIDLAIDAFVSVPYWQFFLQVSTDRVTRLASKDAVLLDADGDAGGYGGRGLVLAPLLPSEA